MADYIYSLILLFIALIAIELRKSYHAIPKAELRYRAREGDALAERIYHAVAYESSLEAVLWLVIILCLAGSLVIWDSVAPLWLDFIGLVLFLAIAFAWLPRIKPNKFSEKAAIYLTPGLVFVLNYLHPLIKKTSHFGYGPATSHTGLYDKTDLSELVKKQKTQADSRIDPEALKIIQKGLKFRDKKINQFAIAWPKIQHISLNESIGPVVLDELHKKGQLFIPVVDESDQRKVIGMVDISRLDLSEGGDVRRVLDRRVYYLNEDDSLEDGLIAMATTGSQIFVVIDKKNRVFGLISLKDVLGQLMVVDKIPKDYSSSEPAKDNSDTSEHPKEDDLTA